MVGTAKCLLAKGAYVDARNYNGYTALHFACNCDRGVDTIHALLDYDAKDFTLNSHGLSPLHYACRNGFTEAARAMLEGCTSSPKRLLTQKDRNGCTALHFCVEKALDGNNLDTVVLLVETFGADVQPKDNEGVTPLHRASSHGRADIVDYLLEHGSDADAVDNFGHRPLHEACLAGNEDCAKILLEKGKAQANANTLFNPPDVLGYTPLQFACWDGHVNAAKVVLDHGGDIDETSSTGGLTALHVAAANGQEPMIRFLHQRGAKIDVEDSEGLTAIDLASKQGELECLQCLMDLYGDAAVNLLAV